MFKLIHKDKKGITLIELLITIVIFGLLASLAGMILYALTNNYNNTATRWKVQNAVRLACAKFENNANFIVNSKEIDIFRDTAIDSGIIYDSDTGNWTWQVAPKLITETADDYTYIFSTKAYEAPENWGGAPVEDVGTLTELGYFLFIKYDEKTGYTSANTSGAKGTNSNYPACVLFLNSEGFGEVPVQVEFSVGTNKLEGNSNTESYMNNSIKIDFKSGNVDRAHYNTDTKYVSENLAPSKSVGMKDDQLLFETNWSDTVFPCGWTDLTISGAPTDKLSVKAKVNGEDEIIHTYNVNEISQKGNVLRFLSPLSEKPFEKGSGSAVTTTPNCMGEWTFSDAINAERYLNNLRDFRDNVLRGTTFGDWFIEFYYNDLSPFLIEKTAFLKPVYKVVLTHLSYVCGAIADM